MLTSRPNFTNSYSIEEEKAILAKDTIIATSGENYH